MADSKTDSVADARPEVRPDAGPIYPEFTCGPGPYVSIDFALRGLLIGALGKAPAAPVKFTNSLCPEVAMQTDAEGYVVLKMTVDKPFSLRFDPPSATHLPTRWPEETLRPWSESTAYFVFDAAVKPQLPPIDKGVVFVQVSGSVVGSCGAEEVKLAVKDHPEAVIKYHGALKPFAVDDTLTATSSTGVATITGLAAGTKVTIIGTKTGCDVVQAVDPGTVVVEANTVSLASLLAREPHPSCGSGPWNLVGGTTTERMLDGTKGLPLEGVKVTFDACPGTTATTDKDGHWQVWMSSKMPTFRNLALTGYIPAVGNELAFAYEVDTVDNALRKADTWKPLMPGWDDTKGYAALSVAVPKTGPCSDVAGVTLAIKDMPGAKIHYLDGDPPTPTTGTVTTKKGFAYASGLTPGIAAPGTFTGTKAGCKYETKYDIDTGRSKITAGAYGVIVLYATAL